MKDAKQEKNKEIYSNRIENRQIWINEDIKDSIIYDSLMWVNRWNEEDENIIPEKRKTIKIYINSPGGSVVDGFALCSAMIRSDTPVETHNIGAAFSMGFLIFLAGHKRYADEFSHFMNHSATTGSAIMKIQDLSSYSEWSDELNKNIADYVFKRTNMTRKQIQDDNNKDHWFGPEEAVRLGVADEIVKVLK